MSSSLSLKSEEEVPIDIVLRALHSIAGVHRSCHSLPIERYLRIAMSHLDTWSIKHILNHHPSIIMTRNEENDNLPIHDIVDKYFDVKGAIEEDNSKMRNYLLKSRLSRLKEILQLYLECGIAHNVGGTSGSGAGGLFELNQEQIDFVTKRRRAPLQILLSKFELILNHCEKCTLDDVERKERASLLEDAKSCIQICIDVARNAWKARGCKDPFTIMNVAIEVFPLLKLSTMKYILHNFDQVAMNHDSTNNNIVKTYPLHYKDLEDHTVLIKAIHQATKRKQSWGDWKSRLSVILSDDNGGKRCEQCWIRDREGRLPIHIAIERSLAWNNGLKELAETDSSTLLEPDPINGLQPFASIASKKETSPSHLSLIMNLILANPAVIPRVPFTKRLVSTKTFQSIHFLSVFYSIQLFV